MKKTFFLLPLLAFCCIGLSSCGGGDGLNQEPVVTMDDFRRGSKAIEFMSTPSFQLLMAQDLDVIGGTTTTGAKIGDAIAYIAGTAYGAQVTYKEEGSNVYRLELNFNDLAALSSASVVSALGFSTSYTLVGEAIVFVLDYTAQTCEITAMLSNDDGSVQQTVTKNFHLKASS